MATSPRSKRIAILVSGLGAGGAEQVVAQLAHHWSSSGHLVEVIAFDRPDDPIFHHLPATVVVHRLSRSGGFVGMAKRVAALRRVLSARKPDAIISFLTKNNLIAAMATIGTGTRLICAERNNPELQGTHPLWNLLLNLLYRRADAIVCQTIAVRRCFPAAVQDKLATIANPVPPPDVSRATVEVKCVCAVGRLTRQKGFDLLIQGFAVVASHWLDWRLDIWGEGPERAALAALISKLGLEKRVILRGLSPRPRAWVGEAGIFILSSRYEGMPNVLCEAMAAGLPVIATNCDFGPAEIVQHGRSGLLVEPFSADALANSMTALIADPLARDRMGKQAAVAMTGFNPDEIFRQWDQLLLSTIGSRR